MRHFWDTLLSLIRQHRLAAITCGLAVLFAAGGIIAVIAISTHRQPAQTVAATTDTTVTVTAATTLPPVVTTQTIAQTTTTKKKTVQTTRRTTHRTVAPPKVVIEPANIKDDTAKRPDTAITRPAAMNGVTLQFVRDNFGGKGHLLGIDVSRYQGTIDWKKVKAAGVQFAMIRCGYRTTMGGEIYEDAAFRTNMKGAIAAGVPVGVYFFSAAKNETEVLEEAAFVLEVLKPFRADIRWPVAYDFEIFNEDRLTGISASVVTDNAIAFMDTVADAGYTPLLYGSRAALTTCWETARLSGYRVWMAQYVNTLDQKRYTGSHALWQCASDGRVDGIKGDVDINIAYENCARVPTTATTTTTETTTATTTATTATTAETSATDAP